jgi:hypothetical protein
MISAAYARLTSADASDDDLDDLDPDRCDCFLLHFVTNAAICHSLQNSLLNRVLWLRACIDFFPLWICRQAGRARRASHQIQHLAHRPQDTMRFVCSVQKSPECRNISRAAHPAASHSRCGAAVLLLPRNLPLLSLMHSPCSMDMEDLFGDLGIDPMLFFAMLFGGGPCGFGGPPRGFGGPRGGPFGPRGGPDVVFMSPGGGFFSMGMPMGSGPGPFGGGGMRGGPPPRRGGGGYAYYEVWASLLSCLQSPVLAVEAAVVAYAVWSPHGCHVGEPRAQGRGRLAVAA